MKGGRGRRKGKGRKRRTYPRKRFSLECGVIANFFLENLSLDYSDTSGHPSYHYHRLPIQPNQNLILIGRGANVERKRQGCEGESGKEAYLKILVVLFFQ